MVDRDAHRVFRHTTTRFMNPTFRSDRNSPVGSSRRHLGARRAKAMAARSTLGACGGIFVALHGPAGHRLSIVSWLICLVRSPQAANRVRARPWLYRWRSCARSCHHRSWVDFSTPPSGATCSGLTGCSGPGGSGTTGWLNLASKAGSPGCEGPPLVTPNCMHNPQAR